MARVTAEFPQSGLTPPPTPFRSSMHQPWFQEGWTLKLGVERGFLEYLIKGVVGIRMSQTGFYSKQNNCPILFGTEGHIGYRYFTTKILKTSLAFWRSASSLRIVKEPVVASNSIIGNLIRLCTGWATLIMTYSIVIVTSKIAWYQ